MTRGYSIRRALRESFGLNLVWMNCSEVARYFLVVKPMMKRAFAEVPGIVPGTPAIAALWTVWDSLLIGVTVSVCWLFLDRFGPTQGNAVAAGTLVWIAVFVLLWLGLHNMGLATPAIMAAALPLAWLELVFAAWLVAWRMRRVADRAASVIA